MVDQSFYVIVLLIGLILWIAALLAQFRLFSIDNTLKQILQRLDAQGAAVSSSAATNSAPVPPLTPVIIVDREVSECTNCHYQTMNLNPGCCGNCGNKKWGRKIVKVASAGSTA